MITEERFWTAWRALCERFRIGPDDPLQGQARMYYDFLRDLMTDAQFREGARTVWASNEFFPKPVDFLEPLALAEFESLREACVLESPEKFRALRPETRAALRTIGGKFAVTGASDRDLRRLQQHFVDAFGKGAAKRGRKELAAGPPPEKRWIPAPREQEEEARGKLLEPTEHDMK